MKTKQNMANQVNDNEPFSPFLEKLKQETDGFKAPEGYFDSLSSKIIDRIQKQQNEPFLLIIFHSFRKPLIWVPSLASVAVVFLLILVLPDKTSMDQPADEWTQINMAYDPSYAEEVILAESNTIDKEIQGKEIKYYDPETLSAKDAPTDAEILDYLKDHTIDTDILNQY